MSLASRTIHQEVRYLPTSIPSTTARVEDLQEIDLTQVNFPLGTNNLYLPFSASGVEQTYRNLTPVQIQQVNENLESTGHLIRRGPQTYYSFTACLSRFIAYEKDSLASLRAEQRKLREAKEALRPLKEQVTSVSHELQKSTWDKQNRSFHYLATASKVATLRKRYKGYADHLKMKIPADKFKNPLSLPSLLSNSATAFNEAYPQALLPPPLALTSHPAPFTPSVTLSLQDAGFAPVTSDPLLFDMLGFQAIDPNAPTLNFEVSQILPLHRDLCTFIDRLRSDAISEQRYTPNQARFYQRKLTHLAETRRVLNTDLFALDYAQKNLDQEEKELTQTLSVVSQLLPHLSQEHRQPNCSPPIPPLLKAKV